MKRKYIQLVEHATPWPHYCLHEALLEDDEVAPYWVGSKPLARYDNYTDAITAWGKRDKKASSRMDILHFDEVESIMDKVEYTDETEINFD